MPETDPEVTYLNCLLYTFEDGALLISFLETMGEPDSMYETETQCVFNWSFGTVRVEKSRLIITFYHNQDKKVDIFVRAARSDRQRDFGPTTFLPALYFIHPD